LSNFVDAGRNFFLIKRLISGEADFYQGGVVRSDKLIDSLRLFLEKGSDWERKPTTLSGVFIVKLPPYGKSPTRLVVEINPVDSSGKPSRRKGFIIRNFEEFKAIREIFADDKLADLLKCVDDVNPQAPERPKPRHDEEVIEI
jgi:hypothetical protein